MVAFTEETLTGKNFIFCAVLFYFFEAYFEERINLLIYWTEDETRAGSGKVENNSKQIIGMREACELMLLEPQGEKDAAFPMTVRERIHITKI